MAVSITVSVVRGNGVIDKRQPGRILPSSAAVKKQLIVEHIVDVVAASAISYLGSGVTGTVINYNDPSAAGRDEITVTEGTAAVISSINA